MQLEYITPQRKPGTNPTRNHLTYSISHYYLDYGKKVRAANRKGSNLTEKSRPIFRNFILDVFADIFDKVLTEAWHFVLPGGCGDIHIRQFKNVYDKPRMKKNGEWRKYIPNPRADGKKIKIVWSKEYATFDNKKYYSFKLISGKYEYSKKRSTGKEALDNFVLGEGKYINTPVIMPINEAIKNPELIVNP